ncbi:MAG: penicillin-binding protein 1A [Alphaproteobacteria bacterium]|nr:penicillin-binding protein 1A [Alphaproteobacteria bacterium]
MRFLFRLILRITVVCVMLAVIGAALVLSALWHFGRGLPDYEQLADYQPPVLTRVHAGDGRVLAEFASERRLFVPVEAMPRLAVRTFLSAEDKSFYSHPGVSLPDIARAAVQNLMQRATGAARRPVGASTITQQVAKNFLLTNEVTLERKAKEAILALRIERALPKDRILELYLNEIYLGVGAYGVAAAALNYFNKSLDELTIAEAAFLAALPKAPNNYHPQRYPEAARDRRNWVLGRMLEDGVINDGQYQQARAEPLVTRFRGETDAVRADYFAEEVRRELLARYGENGLYRGGLSVRTTLDPRLQGIADRALTRGLIAYDRRHGWRGAISRLDTAASDWPVRLSLVPKPPGFPSGWYGAVVLQLSPAGAEIGFADASRGFIPFGEIQWARQRRDEQKLGPPLKSPAEALSVGDVIAVEPLESSPEGRRFFALRQIPNIGGGLVALDPHTGRVLAMSGGWSFELSQFNRATQALRQPGSSFKPFVYLAALENGFTPASLVLDAPIVIDQGPGQGKWKPANYSRNFFGPSPLRVGVEQSRNLMTVRLAQHIGVDKVVDVAHRFDISDNLPSLLSTALGASETTLLRLTTAYAELVNGGYKITPTLIDRVQDRSGKTIYRHDPRLCESCRTEHWPAEPAVLPPALPETRERVVDAATAYQMVSMLQGVVDRGTGRRIKDLNKPLAGKTGTTNSSFDTWFVGFAPDLAVGVFVGFDNPRTLGPNETGASVAVPIFREFMADALRNKPAIPFRQPPGVRLVRVNAQTGLPAQPGERDSIWEAFKPGTENLVARPVLDGGTGQAPAMVIPATDQGGGLY